MIKPGPLGTFSQGKLDDTDEGDLMVAISGDDKVVRIDFGKRIAWFAMDRDLALQFVMKIMERLGFKSEISHRETGEKDWHRAQ
jgi:hypothetical protein